MKRYLQLLFAVLFAVLSFAYGGVSASATATEPQNLPDINAWFSSLTPAELQPFLADFTAWETAGYGGVKVTFGKASPVLEYELPVFNLKTATVTGPVQLANALVSTGEYCARGLVDGTLSDFVVCAEPNSTGSDYQVFGADEVRFVNSYKDADLPAAGTTYPGHDFIGLDNGSVVPLDESAASWLGVPKIDGSTFVTLVAKRKAESAAVVAAQGETVGGELPLIGGDSAAITTFEDAVAKGSGVPVSELTHPSTLAEAERGEGSLPRGDRSWLVPSASLALLGAVAIVATARRRHKTT